MPKEKTLYFGHTHPPPHLQRLFHFLTTPPLPPPCVHVGLPYLLAPLLYPRHTHPHTTLAHATAPAPPAAALSWCVTDFWGDARAWRRTACHLTITDAYTCRFRVAHYLCSRMPSGYCLSTLLLNIPTASLRTRCTPPLHRTHPRLPTSPHTRARTRATRRLASRAP